MACQGQEGESCSRRVYSQLLGQLMVTGGQQQHPQFHFRDGVLFKKSRDDRRSRLAHLGGWGEGTSRETGGDLDGPQAWERQPGCRGLVQGKGAPAERRAGCRATWHVRAVAKC